MGIFNGAGGEDDVLFYFDIVVVLFKIFNVFFVANSLYVGNGIVGVIYEDVLY